MENNIFSIGIFFDGTGNNGINATSSQKQKPQKNNESYYSCITNVYKLFELFIGDEKLYVEGIGTVTGCEDSDFAMATCLNPAGYTGYSSEDKLKQAFRFVNDTMTDKSKEYHFYIYGFSRGSMLARNFCYEILQSDPKIKENIKVKFLGVFDTVESTPFNDYNVTVLPGVERALQICAVNECRYFFPLTGFFDSSKEKEDTLYQTPTSIQKEIFVPGVHADVGGGYLNSSQSVYVSANHLSANVVAEYIENVRTNATDADENQVWDYPLETYQIDKGDIFSQAYVSREMVFNDLSKVYGMLMLTETNTLETIFSTHFNDSNFGIDSNEHPYLVKLSEELQKYIPELAKDLKPAYDYEKLADYTHFSANFGLYHNILLRRTDAQIDAELINNGLNGPSNAQGELVNSVGSKLQSKVNLMEDSIIDYAYGTNIPNNDNWSRTILIKENLYNKC
ncbi:hypothetical protein ACM39_10740 [Chryseobacterium sp. FH2]|uniref:T6SS phospholipase effector Tle1-like catalytic domain-containing protein n=1 Tax=Chryseobacterium sp. FH2 TaxID=1674291 RepID=UPI00065AA2E8|nr:DUF2235 domain-containing protein [Chryseobacterium sp. FH2]KMQ67814.1 hypothetical protein ACM39_10740 [Chryseobacterium sp. FH2]